MIERSFLFMSGESSVTALLAFSNPEWDHTTVPSILVQSEYVPKFIRRKNRPREILKGVIHYCDTSDKEIEINNLKLIINNNIKCWPDPVIMLKMTNRHAILEECKSAGFIEHNIFQGTYDEMYSYISSGKVVFPCVLKTGTEHRGLGKYLLNSIQDWFALILFEGIGTLEPYFDGKSVRVLIIGEDIFCIETTNSESWIKNSPGGEIEKIVLNQDIMQHAKNVSKYFNLDISGTDYILEPDGSFHFLEINQYPGVAGFDDVERTAKEFFKQKMNLIQN